MLVSAPGMPGGARRLPWQEEEVPEKQEILLSGAFSN